VADEHPTCPAFRQTSARRDGGSLRKCWANQHWPCRGGTAVNTFVLGPSRKFLEISQDMAAVANAPVQGPMKFQKQYAGVLSALGGLRFGNIIKSVDPIVWDVSLRSVQNSIK